MDFISGIRLISVEQQFLQFRGDVEAEAIK